MTEHRKRDQNPLNDPAQEDNEPVHLPSQAEGPDDGEDEETSLHLRTGGQAEGTREAVDDQLRRQEQQHKNRQG